MNKNNIQDLADKAWNQMQSELDKHLPVRKNKKRKWFLLFFLAGTITALTAFFALGFSNNIRNRPLNLPIKNNQVAATKTHFDTGESDIHSNNASNSQINPTSSTIETGEHKNLLTTSKLNTKKEIKSVSYYNKPILPSNEYTAADKEIIIKVEKTLSEDPTSIPEQGEVQKRTEFTTTESIPVLSTKELNIMTSSISEEMRRVNKIKNGTKAGLGISIGSFYDYDIQNHLSFLGLSTGYYINLTRNYSLYTGIDISQQINERNLVFDQLTDAEKIDINQKVIMADLTTGVKIKNAVQFDIPLYVMKNFTFGKLYSGVLFSYRDKPIYISKNATNGPGGNFRDFGVSNVPPECQFRLMAGFEFHLNFRLKAFTQIDHAFYQNKTGWFDGNSQRWRSGLKFVF